METAIALSISAIFISVIATILAVVALEKSMKQPNGVVFKPPPRTAMQL